MRIDGRLPDQIRPFSLELNYTRYAEGSVLVRAGHTIVLCNATVEGRLPAWMVSQGHKGGWVTAEYAMLPRSTHSRTPRETNGVQPRSQEIRRLISRSLRASVDLLRLGQRQVIVDCDVIQADGGTRTASITGAYVALVLALRGLIAAGEVAPETLVGPVAAVSVGIVSGELLLDLCYEEDSQADVDMNLVMDGSGRFVDLQGTAEHVPFERATLERLLELGEIGIRQLLAAQAKALAA